ncbi:MAG: cell division protein FtsA [Kiritimatiellia bacterium]|jgi:cell division protein FtsA
MSNSILTAVEIGTTRTQVLVGEPTRSGNINVIGVGDVPSYGVRKGMVSSTQDALGSLLAALKDAQETSDVQVRYIQLGIANSSVETKPNVGTLSFHDADHTVTADDIEDVEDLAYAFSLRPDRELMHSFPVSYSINDQHYIQNPMGMRASSLSLRAIAIHAAHDRTENVCQVCRNAQLEIDSASFSGLAAAEAVFTDEQKQNGVAVIDLGGGTTKFLVCERNTLTDAGVIGIGGNHLTNDLAVAFGVATAVAEKLKREHGSALLTQEAGAARCTLPGNTFTAERTISVRAVQTVTNARMDELFRLVRARLVESGALHRIGSGIVLTGGGAALPQVAELASGVFGLPCAVARALKAQGLPLDHPPAAYATLVGLLRIGNAMLENEVSSSPMTNWLRKFLRKP